MTGGVLMTAADLAVNLAAAAIASAATVAVGRVRQRSRRARRASFLGVGDEKSVLVVVPSDPAVEGQVAVHPVDVQAVVELAGLVRGAGAEEKVQNGSDRWDVGEVPEICVAGPEANNRTAVHLRTFLPGLTFDPYSLGRAVTIKVGGREFPLVKGQAEYVVLARLRRPDAAPILLISGQTAITNLAAARYLTSKVPELTREFGSRGQFCLVLRVVEPPTYGTRSTERVGDFFVQAARSTDHRT